MIFSEEYYYLLSKNTKLRTKLNYAIQVLDRIGKTGNIEARRAATILHLERIRADQAE